MVIYRLTSPNWANTRDILAGASGSRLPGRWNTKGYPVIYATSSPEVAIREMNATQSHYGIPVTHATPYVVVAISISDLITRERIYPEQLPHDWKSYKWRDAIDSAPAKTQRIGTDWLKRKSSGMLIVPSALVKKGFNILLNPAHRDFAEIKLVQQEEVANVEITERKTRIPVKGDYSDVFISYASEDTQSVVKPLASALDREGISYWLDKEQIGWGDSITGKVNEGLKNCRFVIVVLSTAYLKKDWPKREWQSALNMEIALKRTFVLPLLVGNDDERKHIVQELVLQNDKARLIWNGDTKPIARALIEALTRGG